MAATTGPIGARLESIRYIKEIPLAANVKINQGADVATDSAGRLVPVTSSSTITPMGVAPKTYDNTGGAAGAVLGTIDLMRDVLCRGYLNDSAPNAVDATDRGTRVYHLDDQSVTTDGTNRTQMRGRVIEITTADSSQGAYVWVEVL